MGITQRETEPVNGYKMGCEKGIGAHSVGEFC